MFQFALCPFSKRADTQPVTKELFDKVLDSPIVAETCRKIADQMLGTASPDESIRELAQKKVTELKSQLPAFCWHATYANGKRKNYDAQPSGLAMMDYDHIDNPQDIFGQIREKAIGMNLVAAHITPSCAGLRLVFAMPEGCSIRDFQRFMAGALGIKGHDTCVHDLARISYAVTRQYWLYIDEAALFGEGGMVLKPVDIQPGTPVQRVTRNDRPQTPVEAVNATDGQQPVAKSYPKDYKGIPFEKIVDNLEYYNGGRPMHSIRNQTIFAMACCLRQICDNDPDWVATILPDYGEERGKWYSTIRSACNRPMPQRLSPMLVKSIELARNMMNARKGTGAPRVTVISEPNPPDMPEVLPPMVEHLIKNTPIICRPSVAHGIFPPLSTHIHGVRFRMIDGSYREPAFICVNMAPQSSGKSSINMPSKYINADIKERDEVNRRREQEWKDACKTNKKEEQPRPKNLVVQLMRSDMTNAALVQKLIDAEDFPLYSNLNELEYLKQMQINGSRDVGKLLCLAYDRADFGQERVGVQSVTGCVTLRWNINAASTIQKGISFFRNNLLDGTLTRINFCTIMRDETVEYAYGDYNEEYAAVLKPYITNLNIANGCIHCEQALEMARRLQRKCLEMCDMAGDDVMRDFVYRAVEIAYVKAMVLYIAHNMEWDERIEEFIEWSLMYDLWCKNYFFGALLAEANQMENVKQRPGQANLLDCLPNSFAIEMASQLRAERGMDANAKHMLSNWMTRGYIVYNHDTSMYEKTEKYLKRK